VREDRDRWTKKYRAAGFTASFLPHPLAVRALALPLPPGPVLDLASGPSGSALLAAEAGRPSVAVDISEAALSLLSEQARTSALTGPLALVQADLDSWRPRPSTCALVLCTGYWEAGLFAAAAGAVMPGGMLAWEALTTEALRRRPDMPGSWCLRPGEPAGLLPLAYEVLDEEDLPDGLPATKRRMLARRRPEPE
jgi:SAM-dependent methyltransferase